MSVRSDVFPLFAGLAPIAVAIACYGPTQVEIEVLTDLPCGPDGVRAAIYVGRPGAPDGEPQAQTVDEQCQPLPGALSSLGTLVVAPSSGDRSGTVRVRVKLARGKLPAGGRRDAAACERGSPDCIFATRQFSYVEHASQRLPIRLYADCLGNTTCAEGQTCIQGGKCVSDQVTCSGDRCTAPEENPEAPPPPDDGGRSDGGSTDSAVTPRCVGPTQTDLVMNVLSIPALAAASDEALYWVAPVALGPGRDTVMRLNKSTLAGRPTTALSAGVSETFSALTTHANVAWAISSSSAADSSPTLRVEGSSELFLTGVTEPVVALTVADAAFGQGPSQPRAFFSTAGNMWTTTPSGPPGALIDTNGRKIGPMVRLTHDADRLIMIAGSIVGPGELTIFDFAGKSLISLGGTFDDVATDGTTAFVGGIPKGSVDTPIIGSVGPSDVTTLVRGVAPIELAVDDAYVYWVEHDKGALLDVVKRAARASAGPMPPEPVVVPADSSRATIRHIAVDRDPAGCIYFWSDGLTKSSSALRVTPKP